MNNIQRLPINPARVVAVLLADGWHYVVPGSFTVGPLGFGVDDNRLGFRFDEDDDTADEPTSITGALDTLLAIRQSPVRGIGPEVIETARPARQTVDATQHPSHRGLN
ncbi:MAG TPA: hypothetical protein VFI00_17470 [Kribbella sp.]|nr:hypothetical protein [Kribbella sp.]